MSTNDLVRPFDPREWLREQMRKTPWWATSASFHILALACLTLIAFQERIREQVTPLIIDVNRPRPEKVRIPPEKVRAEVDSPGLRSESDDVAMPFPEVNIPDAILGDHIETASKLDGNTALGDSLDFTGWRPGSGGGRDGSMVDGPPGEIGRIGVGGGNGSTGRYGTRDGGGRVNMTAIGGGRGTESGVTAGLRWLARHQGADGGWHGDPFAECAPGTPCTGAGYAQYDVGLTGLALLAYLGAGYTHLSRETYIDPHTLERVRFGDAVKRGVEFLRSQQDADGCFGPRTGEFMYNHSIAALAMAEAFGLTNAVQYRGVAQDGIDFLAQAQNPYRGWRYTVKPGDNDTSVTGWCVMALKSADISGLTVPHTGYDGARAWLDSATDVESGEIGYSGRGKVDVVVRGKNEQWAGHPAMTAVGLLSKIFIDRGRGDALHEKHAARLVSDLPRWDVRASGDGGARSGRPIDFYYWYYGSLALFQYDGPSGKCWRAWNEAMKAALIPHQGLRRDGCADGSWDPGVDRWGFAGGRVYATAINVLTLEVYYRYARVLGGDRGK